MPALLLRGLPGIRGGAATDGTPGAWAQGVVKYACSEEVPEPVDLQGSGFSVAFDPLDGSSIVDTNFTVGTIFGIWPGDKLTGITGRDQVPPLPGYHP